MIPRLLILCLCLSAFGADKYVSPTGSSGNSGAVDSPWSLRFAMTNAAGIAAGDTIFLRGGTYQTGQTIAWPYTANVTLVGTSNSYITIKSFTNETAVIDPGLYHISGNYVVFQNLYFTCSTERTNDYAGRPAGLSVAGRDKVINCVFYDTGHPSVVGSAAEVYGNILSGCGIFEFDNQTHFATNPWVRGSALYMQNSSVETSLIQDNISRGNLNAGMKAYAENGQVQNFIFDGNISFGNNGEGIEVECLNNPITNAVVQNNFTYRCLKNPMGYFDDRAGLSLAHHISLTYSNNYDYGSPGAGVALLWLKRWTNITVVNNTIITTSQTNEWTAGSGVGLGFGGKFIQLEPITNVTINYTINNNAYYGGVEQGGPWYDAGIFNKTYVPFYNVQSMPYDGTNGMLSFAYWTNKLKYDLNSSYTTNLPTVNVVTLRTNKYQQGRAHLVVFNWESNNAVNVNLSSAGLVNGQRFQVRDVQNYFGTPILTTNYNSSSPTISIPLTSTNVTAIAGAGFAESFTFNPNIHTASLFNTFVIVADAPTANYLASITVSNLIIGP